MLLQLPIHSDCCNGINFHPTRPIMASSSGQYHFPNDQELNSSHSTQSSELIEEKIVDYENSLLLLWLGKCQLNEDD